MKNNYGALQQYQYFNFALSQNKNDDKRKSTRQNSGDNQIICAGSKISDGNLDHVKLIQCPSAWYKVAICCIKMLKELKCLMLNVVKKQKKNSMQKTPMQTVSWFRGMD